MTKPTPVIGIDALGREFKFPSQSQAAREMGLASPRSVADVIKGRKETAAGYKWRKDGNS